MGNKIFVCNEANNTGVINALERFEANFGGTNILAPLQLSYGIESNYTGTQLKKRVFILTDGQVKDAQDVIQAAKNPAANVHTFGIGSGCD